MLIRGILYNFLVKAILLALLALVLYGLFSAAVLVTILILFIGLRFISLVSEAFRKPVPDGNWEKMAAVMTGQYEKFTSERRATIATKLKLNPNLSASDLAQSQVQRAMLNYLPPRSKRELCAESLGVIAFAILIPMSIALYTHEIFSLRRGQGWEGAIVVAGCIGVYLWPHISLKSSNLSDVRIWWWMLPFGVSLIVLNHAIATRHPYLNPFNPEHDRLAAERVLSLKNNVIAGQYADWVLRYARDLDEKGDGQQAIQFYREALRLDAGNRAAYERLATLETTSTNEPIDVLANPVDSSAPYWTIGQQMIPSPRRRIDDLFPGVTDCTVVIVAIGVVPDGLMEAVGDVIHRELDLPVFISPDPVPLPPHTRVRGLLTDAQWDQSTLARAFVQTEKTFPKGPVKYLLITPVDIYAEDLNYMFSCSYPWGALLSFSRFGEGAENDTILRQRTAKQALCAVLKSFGIPESPDRNDVTSYVRSLPEFDTKGNYPDAETLKLFHRTISSLNSRWHSVNLH